MVNLNRTKKMLNKSKKASAEYIAKRSYMFGRDIHYCDLQDVAYIHCTQGLDHSPFCIHISGPICGH